MRFPAYLVLLATLVAHVLLPSVNAIGFDNDDGKRIAVCTTLGIKFIDIGEPDNSGDMGANSSFQCPCVHFSSSIASTTLILPSPVKSSYLPLAIVKATPLPTHGYSSRAPPVSFS